MIILSQWVKDQAKTRQQASTMDTQATTIDFATAPARVKEYATADSITELTTNAWRIVGHVRGKDTSYTIREGGVPLQAMRDADQLFTTQLRDDRIGQCLILARLTSAAWRKGR
jgi:hypothetical protein